MKKTVILSALAFAGIQANAQVNDISVTLQPTASYNWFDNNAAIKDGVMVGGRLGFGFGEAFELRGTYEKSLDLKNTVSKINADWLDPKGFESRKVEVERIGGEMKANIPTGADFAPYITLGSGVQKLKVDNFDGNKNDVESQQIYASGGLGVKVNLGDRLTFNVEGKNTLFNLNPTNVLYNPTANTTELEEWLNDTDKTRMYNWSVLAGLQLYLGGRKGGEMTELDKAYYRKFSGGLSGLKLIVEPGIAYVDFDKKSNLKDTYLLGGQAGFDFNQFIGLRAFYYQSTKNEEVSTNWDDMAMYGGDLTAKLNVSRGLVPYLTIGGGYINAYNNYKGDNTTITTDESGYFAKGGLGLVVPVTKNLELFGAANLMYTTSRDKENFDKLTSPDELKQHTMYNAGIRVQFGKSADEDATLSEVVANKLDNVSVSDLNKLESKLKEAYKEGDFDRVVKYLEQKLNFDKKSVGESRIRMTPEELESLVDKVIKGVDEEYGKGSDKDRIDRLERLLLETNRNNGQVSDNNQDTTSQRILEELRILNSKVDANSNNISNLNGVQNSNKDVAVKEEVKVTYNNDDKTGMVATYDENGNKEEAISKGLFLYKGMSVFAGAAIGNEVAPVLGVRGHYTISNSGLEFMPDIYVSPSSQSGFGLNANAIYGFDQFTKGAFVKPYVGVGVGYNTIEDVNKFGTNLLIGTSFDVLGGNLYADYTARGFVDMHQVSVGYKLGF